MLILLIAFSLSAGNIYCSDSKCTNCLQGLKYSKLTCVLYCPEGSFESNSECEIISKYPFINLKFSEFLDYTATNILDFQHPLGLPFSDSSKLSPIPTKDRGFYFDSNSSLVSNRSWIIGPICYLHILVKIDKEGGIFKVGNREMDHFYLHFTDGKVNFEVLLYKNEAEVLYTLNQAASIGEWVTFIFTSNLKEGLTEIQVVNKIVKKLYKSEIMPTPGLNFTIGCSFNGFIYEMKLGNIHSPYYQPNAFAPVCEFNQFYNNNLFVCENCPSNCSDWPWCTRDSCNICFNDKCLLCNGYGLFDCSLCSNNLTAPFCEYPLNCVSGLLFNCIECEEGFYNSNGLCITTPTPNASDSLLPVFNLKFNDFSELYGELFQSGNNSNTFSPFNNQEIDDPYPVYKRGLYFNSSSNLQSIISISLNTSFTFAFWAFFDNYQQSSLLYSSNLKITNFMLTFIRLSNEHENRTFVTRHFQNSINHWKFFYITVFFENSCQNVRTGFDNLVIFNLFSSAGYGFYDFPNQHSIGAIKDEPNSGFSGFLYQVILWQYSIFDFSQYLDACDEGGKVCLWEIGIRYYWNEYENKGLECEKDCYTGCRTWGTCSHCQSVLCDSCSNYNSICMEGSTDFCLKGFSLNAELKCCDLRCQDCYGTGYYRCLACNLGWVLNGNVCIEECPSFFELNSGVCSINSPLVIDLEFDVIYKDIIDSSNGIIFSTPSNISIWPHDNASDPIPAYKRGYYFDKGSYLYSENFSLSYNFSLVFYIKLISPGIIVQKNNLRLELNETYSILQVNHAILYINPLAFGSWMVVIYQVYSDIDGNIVLSIQTENFQNTTSFISYPVILNDLFSNMTLGSKNESFVGFLWKFQIYYSLKDFEDESINVCVSENQANCVLNCGILHYFENNKCQKCLSECEYGCRNGESCELCISSECIQCQSYTECEFCPENSQKIGNKCSCVFGYEENYGVCKPCGNYYLEHLCLDICPLGYTSISSNCSIKLPSGLAIKFSFDSPILIFKDSISNLKSSTSSLIPAYSRGVYFNSSASFISFPTHSNRVLLFGLRFYVCLWLFPETESGSILTNINQFSTQLQLYYKDFYLHSSISLKNSTLFLNSNLQIKQDHWSHLILALDYTTVSSFSIYINGEQSYIVNSQSYLLNQIGGNCQLGFSGDSDSFQGFIYSIESYVKFPEFSSLFSKSCKNCEICLTTGTCLWSCNITNFYSNNINLCKDCNGNCKEGCRNANNCSICTDSECELCSSYYTDSCTQCKDGFELIGSSCYPCSENSYFDDNSKICKECVGLCETCKTESFCFSCKNNSALNDENICKCILGYYGTTNCTRKKFNSILTINTKNVGKIIFTEELAENLQYSEIIVKIDKDVVDFSLNKINGFTYEVQLEDHDIGKNSKLIIYYKKSLISIKNSLHDKKFIEIRLYKQQSEQILESLKVFKQNTKSIFMSSIGGLIGASILNFDPNCLYTFLNSAELFSYTVLYDMDLESNIEDFLISIQATQLFLTGILFHTIYRRSMHKDLKSVNDVLSKFGIFFDEFRTETTSEWLFYCLFVLRRIIISILIIYVQYSILQLTISIILSLAVMLYVFVTNCFKDLKFKYYLLWCELLVVMFYTTLIISIDKNSKEKTFTYLIIAIVMVVLGATVFFSLIGLLKKVWNCCCRRKKIAIDIVPAEPVIKLEDFNCEMERIFKMKSPVFSSSCEGSINEEKGVQNSFVDLNDSPNYMYS